MSKTITELWYGNLSPMSHSGNNNSEMKNLLRLMEKNYETLEKGLNKRQKEIFKNFYECTNEYMTVIGEQAFCDGFSLAAKILTEALASAEQIV